MWHRWDYPILCTNWVYSKYWFLLQVFGFWINRAMGWYVISGLFTTMVIETTSYTVYKKRLPWNMCSLYVEYVRISVHRYIIQMNQTLNNQAANGWVEQGQLNPWNTTDMVPIQWFIQRNEEARRGEVWGVIHECEIWIELYHCNCCFMCLIVLKITTIYRESSGGRLNKKDGLTRYGDSHVKDKTS